MIFVHDKGRMANNMLAVWACVCLGTGAWAHDDVDAFCL